MKITLTGLVITAQMVLCAPVDYTKIDISLMPTVSRPTSQRIYLMSYGNGEVYQRNQNYLIQSAFNRGIDTFISYRKEHIDSLFYNEHKRILDQPRGAGYWLWKPYFFIETLKRMADNDILIYIDAGAYLNEKSLQPIIDFLEDPETSIVLFENYHTNREYIKRDTYDIMNVDYVHRDDMQLEGGFIVVKKTPITMEFMKNYLHYCCIEQALTDCSSKAEEFKDFWDHRHDQAILTLLRIKQPQGIKVVSRYKDYCMSIFHVHKRRYADQPMSECDYCY